MSTNETRATGKRQKSHAPKQAKKGMGREESMEKAIRDYNKMVKVLSLAEGGLKNTLRKFDCYNHDDAEGTKWRTDPWTTREHELAKKVFTRIQAA